MAHDAEEMNLFSFNEEHTNVRTINVRFQTAKVFEDWIESNREYLPGRISTKIKEYDLTTHETVNWGEVERLDKPETSYSKTKKYWTGLPCYVSKKIEPEIHMIFRVSDETVDLLAKMLDQNVTPLTKSLNHPKLPKNQENSFKRFIGDGTAPRYPMYVVSKGRPNDNTTSFYLSLMEIPHFVVVEPQQMEMYKASTLLDFKYCTLLELDMKYQDDYDTYDELGNTKSKGPGAARNFAWDHSISQGHKWHWVFDDNTVGGFYRLYNNKKIRIRSGAGFRAMEDFVDRFENIAQAGLNYLFFVNQDVRMAPFTMNTRIYSYLLIRNDIPFRWRGRYNEDTDLSLRILKSDYWCTVQFNTYLAQKARTQQVKGGNTEEFYAKEGTVNKSQMLVDMHPDVAFLMYRFAREHHYVDYSGFKQPLIFKDGKTFKDWALPDNEYGMRLVDTVEELGDKSKEKYLTELNAEYLDTENEEQIIPQDEG